jgi:hypothetical protein
MSFDAFSDVNYLAVLAAALAYFALGAIWYIPPVMGNTWQKAGGIEMPEGQAGPNPVLFVGTYVAYAAAGLATALLAVGTGSDTAAEGVVLGLIVGVGYAFTAAAVTALYDRKPQPMIWWLVNGIFNVIGLVVVALIISVWR